MDYDEEYLALARRVLSRPALDYRELSRELEDEGWFSRSLDAAILDLIRVQQGNPEILRSSPFFRKVAQGGIEALSAYLEVLLLS